MKIIVYSKDNCVWCDRAKNLLDSVEFSFEEIDLSNDNDRQEFYKKVGEGVSTVPQIYIDNERIGGFPQLVNWFEENGF
ncbi:MAG: ribonucleoside-diphosphate reductase [Actinobacteria bacterium]|nr:ribonucleoside-diphosphate reductase [Actinomycetota bacterium]